jgi:hypothetical protein
MTTVAAHSNANQCDCRNCIIGIGGGAVALTSWANVVANAIPRSNVVDTINGCCEMVLNETSPICKSLVTKTFGNGLTVANVTFLCNDTLVALKSTFTSNLVFYAVLGSSLTLGGFVLLGKTMYDRHVRLQYQEIPDLLRSDL